VTAAAIATFVLEGTPLRNFLISFCVLPSPKEVVGFKE
jgi:hypothetical protein